MSRPALALLLCVLLAALPAAGQTFIRSLPTSTNLTSTTKVPVDDATYGTRAITVENLLAGAATNSTLLAAITNQVETITDAALGSYLPATNGTAVALSGSLTNVTLWTTNDTRVGTAKAEALQLRNLQTGSRFWFYLTNADSSPQIVLTATPDTDDATGLGASTLDDRLKAWTSGQSYQVTAATYDSDGVVTTATVLWPDGSAGTFTTTTKNTSFLAVDAFTITHTGSGKTVTQAAVTRDDFGAVTTKPALTVL